MDRRKLAVSLAAALLASSAMAATPRPDAGRLVSDYAGWAGGRQNAEALVRGLHDGTSIMISTTAPDRHVSLAGFTPSAPLGYDEIASSLGNARAALARMGIAHPDAEQIQAALIGGEVAVPNRGARVVRGTIAVRGGNPRVASR